MKFLDNIGLYSFILVVIQFILVPTATFIGDSAFKLIFILFPIVFIGGITGLIRHKSKRDLIFAILSVLVSGGILLILILAATNFHD